MLIFTEVINGTAIAINPDHIIAVFTASEGEYKDNTVISVPNGSILVNEDVPTVLGAIKGAKYE